MKVTDFSGSLNTLSPPDAIADNEFSTLSNICRDEGSILRSRYGLTRIISRSNIRKVYPFYVRNGLRLIHTTTSGLYDNTTLLDASFTGPFIAAEYGGMLYLTNGTYLKRYDGTTLLNVGMAAPAAPTVTASTLDKIVVDAFETNPTAYAISANPAYNGGGTGTVARETGAGNFTEGSSSIKMVCPAGKAMLVSRVFTTALDWSVYPGGGKSGGTDFFTAVIRVNNPAYMFGMKFLVNVSTDGTGAEHYDTPLARPGVEFDGVVQSGVMLVYDPAAGSYRRVPKYKVMDKLKMVYLPSAADSFVLFSCPKANMQRSGTTASRGWHTVKGLQIAVWASADIPAGENLEVYIDDAAILGAEGNYNGLNGRYSFCAGYYNSARDEYYEVSEESDPLMLVLGNIDYSGVPASFPDAQADKYIIWAREEAESAWHKLVEVSEGTTSGTVNTDLDKLLASTELTEYAGIYPLPTQLPSGQIRTRATSNNSVPPVGSFIVMHRGKLFILKDEKIYHSKPGQPWAVPSLFWATSASTSDSFTAAYSDGSSLIVHTHSRDLVYMNAGEYDAGFVYMGYLAEGKRMLGCVAPHSASGGLFCSSHGIATFDGQFSELLSGPVTPTFNSIPDKTLIHATTFETSYIIVKPSLGEIGAIVMERLGERRVFQTWAIGSTPRCCVEDRRANRLYIGTDTGIYYYNSAVNVDDEGAFTMKAWTKKKEYAPENEDMPLERWGIEVNGGGNTVGVSVKVDGVEHGGSTSIVTTEQREVEDFMDLGAVGSKVQVGVEAIVDSGEPVRVYGIEVS